MKMNWKSTHFLEFLCYGWRPKIQIFCEPFKIYSSSCSVIALTRYNVENNGYIPWNDHHTYIICWEYCIGIKTARRNLWVTTTLKKPFCLFIALKIKEHKLIQNGQRGFTPRISLL